MERLKVHDDHVGLVGTKQCTAVHDDETNNAYRQENGLVYAVDDEGIQFPGHHRLLPLLWPNKNFQFPAA